jgi:hypothetical protein
MEDRNARRQVAKEKRAFTPDRREFLIIGGAASAVAVLSACGVRVNRGTFPVP